MTESYINPLEPAFGLLSILETSNWIAEETLDQLPEMLAITDQQGTIYKANQSFLREMGLESSSVLSHSILAMVTPTAKKFFESCYGESKLTLEDSFTERVTLQKYRTWRIAKIQHNIYSEQPFYIFLASDSSRQIHMEASLAAAGYVQNVLLPSNFDSQCVEMVSYYNPLENTGGDWFDYIHDRKNNRFILGFGDVTGHGMGAALITGVLSGSFKATFETINRVYGENDPCKVLQCIASTINNTLNHTSEHTHMCASMIFLSLDLEDHSFFYLGGGHPPIYIIGKDSLSFLQTNGPLFGELPDSDFTVKTAKLEKEHCLFIFSDGLTEHGIEKGRPLRSRHIKKNIGYHKNTRQIRANILAQLEKNENKEKADDISLLLINRTQ